MTNTDTSDECPECGGEIISMDNERVCEDCGLVMEDEMLDRGPEWRAFNSKEREEKSRVGSPITTTKHEKGLTTDIDWRDKDYTGKQLSAQKRQQMSRLRTWQSRIKTKDAKERNLKFALSELDRMVSSLGLSEHIEEVAATLYRTALDKDLIRGRSIEGVVSACLYAACRMEGVPRTFGELERVARVEEKEIAKTYRYIVNELEINVPLADPKAYVPRFCSQLNLPKEVENKALEIIEKSIDKGLLSGKSPTGFAAAAVYSASLILDKQNDDRDLKRTQEEVAEVADVTAVTIRNRYQEQIKAIDLDL